MSTTSNNKFQKELRTESDHWVFVRLVREYSREMIFLKFLLFFTTLKILDTETMFIDF